MREKSSNPRYVELASLLRCARKDNGLTQQNIADELLLSRETIVAIENVHQKSVESIQLEVVHSWLEVCRKRMSPFTRARKKDYFLKYFL